MIWVIPCPMPFVGRSPSRSPCRNRRTPRVKCGNQGISTNDPRRRVARRFRLQTLKRRARPTRESVEPPMTQTAGGTLASRVLPNVVGQAAARGGLSLRKSAQRLSSMQHLKAIGALVLFSTSGTSPSSSTKNGTRPTGFSSLIFIVRSENFRDSAWLP